MKPANTSDIASLPPKNVYRPPSFFCHPPPAAPIVVFPFEAPITPPAVPPDIQMPDLETVT